MRTAERNLVGIEALMSEKAEEMLAITDAAESDERELNDDEKAQIEKIRGDIEVLKTRQAEAQGLVDLDSEARELGRKLVKKGHNETIEEQKHLASLGEQFVNADGYKKLLASGLTGDWSTGNIELQAATLLEGTADSPGAGGALLQRDRRPGVLPILYERLTVADLLAQGQTTSNSIEYVVETVADSGSAATVAEGAAKPETRLEFDLEDTPVRKIAVWLPVSEEMLSDAAQIRSYINARLSLFVRIEEEDQLLNKTGSGQDLDGLLNQVPGANQDIASDAAEVNAADHIFAAITQARKSYLEPDGIIVNTDDWAELRLLKDGDGNYIGGSPFSNTGAGEPGDVLWGKRVVVTEAMTAGTALVGAFGSAAQIFRRGGR